MLRFFFAFDLSMLRSPPPPSVYERVCVEYFYGLLWPFCSVDASLSLSHQMDEKVWPPRENKMDDVYIRGKKKIYIYKEMLIEAIIS